MSYFVFEDEIERRRTLLHTANFKYHEIVTAYVKLHYNELADFFK